MSENYYTLEQAAEKLGKTQEQLKEFAKVNDISEMRDGSKIFYNKEDIDSLAQKQVDDDNLNVEDSVIGLDEESSLGGLDSLDDDKSEDDQGEEVNIDEDMEQMIELSDADTAVGKDSPDSESDESEGKEDDASFSDDSLLSLADTMANENEEGQSSQGSNNQQASNEEQNSSDQKDESSKDQQGEQQIDADADMGSDEEGSGILDLSLQADDSQLGAVLDDILPGDEGGGGGDDDFGDFDVGAIEEGEDQQKAEPEQDEAPEAAEVEAEQTEGQDDLSYPEVQPEPEPAAASAPAAAAAASSAEEGTSFGFAMLLPFIAVVMTIVILAGLAVNGSEPLFVPFVQQYFVYIAGGLAVVTLIIGLSGAFSGGSASGKKAGGKKSSKKEKKTKGKKKKKK
ncbi:hypothetical protein L21SP3_00012 [Sedimentisphaera cyanobacteriorum]|uniref:Helix-turn-helix domain-containing protein n=1 Tax=Sedimentisphaera cyanobacteriorum TaxID=1940790 RepID=A0A1Q2HLY8_9BACT|nr:helix-turn-helix domain-containing protein [Sedimentisphaera cyanobacteriorum]AQQ08236.1 hypothetical protein L21SP3_00012 [Sedimentisphaera cyanobacteriorum]